MQTLNIHNTWVHFEVIYYTHKALIKLTRFYVPPWWIDGGGL